MTALVRSPARLSTASGARQKFSSMSANRAVAPDCRTAFSVAAKVNGVVITSSPAPMPRASRVATSAVVPLFTAIAWPHVVCGGESLLELLDDGALSELPGPQDLEDELLLLGTERDHREGDSSRHRFAVAVAGLSAR